MSYSTTHHWSDGDEAAVCLAVGRTRILFGLGPRHLRRAADDRVVFLCQSLAPAISAIRWCRQIHGTVLASLSTGDEAVEGAACVGRCDGLITGESGLGLLVWTADCVPIVLTGGGVIAAVHSGWRGSAAGVSSSAIRRFVVEYGVPPESLTAFLGPAVGPCHYPVGAEVVEALAAVGVPSESWLEGDRRVDLRGLIAGQLALAGVEPDHIHRVAGCTACSEELASYRRDGENAGRQWTLVYRA